MAPNLERDVASARAHFELAVEALERLWTSGIPGAPDLVDHLVEDFQSTMEHKFRRLDSPWYVPRPRDPADDEDDDDEDDDDPRCPTCLGEGRLYDGRSWLEMIRDRTPYLTRTPCHDCHGSGTQQVDGS